MTVSNFLPARDDQLTAPGAWSRTYILDGITIVDATPWHAYIVANKGDDQASASLVTPTVTANAGANTVTFSLTDTQVATLIGSGAPKFTGFWSVYLDSLDVTLVAGSFVLDRTATNSGDAGAATLTYTAGSPVTLTVTTGAPPTAFDSAGSAVAMAIVLGGN